MTVEIRKCATVALLHMTIVPNLFCEPRNNYVFRKSAYGLDFSSSSARCNSGCFLVVSLVHEP